MKRLMQSCLLLAAVACMAAVVPVWAGESQTSAKSAEEKKPAAEAVAIIQGNTAFALEAYGRLKAGKGNIVVSPYCLSTAMAMAWAGARGDTEAQMAKTLHFTLPQASFHPACAELQKTLSAAQVKNQVELLVANSLWPQKGSALLPEFAATCKAQYGAEVTPVDYAAKTGEAGRQINAWVTARTKGHIQNLVAPNFLPAETRLTLVNAVYFNGKWEVPFDPARTEYTTPFYVSPKRTVRVRMMIRDIKPHDTCRLAEAEGLRVLELPYKGGKMSMLVLLPQDKDGLPALEAALTPENLAKWTAALKPAEGSVMLPRFTMTTFYDLRRLLAVMGMPDAFDAGKADFSGMDGTRMLFFSNVLQETVVEVNESGTMGVSALVVVAGGGDGFCADHPFIFIIRENATGSILFIGRVTDPTAR